MFSILKKVGKPRKSLRPNGRRAVLTVDALESRLTPAISVLVHPPNPCVLDLPQQPMPPIPLVSFVADPVYDLTTTVGTGPSTSGFHIDGHASDVIQEDLSVPGAPATPVLESVAFSYDFSGAATLFLTELTGSRHHLLDRAPGRDPSGDYLFSIDHELLHLVACGTADEW
jgi:hypothetical protein